MRVVKKASGKKTIKLSKREWQNIGKKAGWMKKAQMDGNILFDQELPAKMYFGSPGYQWEITVTSYQVYDDKVILNIIDKGEKEEIELNKKLFNLLDSHGFVQYTDKTGGYTTLGFFADPPNEEFDDDLDNLDLSRPGEEAPFYGQGGRYPYNR